jgi:hypothetical protein
VQSHVARFRHLEAANSGNLSKKKGTPRIRCVALSHAGFQTDQFLAMGAGSMRGPIDVVAIAAREQNDFMSVVFGGGRQWVWLRRWRRIGNAICADSNGLPVWDRGQDSASAVEAELGMTV